MSDKPAFIEELEKADPEYAQKYMEVFKGGLAEGELPVKTKILLALALDAGNQYPESVSRLANMAREQGASEREITETVEIVALVCGTQGLATASNAFEDFEFKL